MMIVALTTEIIYTKHAVDHIITGTRRKTRHIHLSAGMTTDKITRSDWPRCGGVSDGRMSEHLALTIVIDKASLDVFACGSKELDVARIPSLTIDLFDTPSLCINERLLFSLTAAHLPGLQSR